MRYICDGNCEMYLDNLFNSLREGFLLSEIICLDNPLTMDFKILELNNSFENMFDVSKEDIIGKTIRQVYPEISAKWIDMCYKVALDGKSAYHNIYLKTLDKHLKINIISPIEGQFIILFDDITQITKANEVLKKHFILFDNAQDVIMYLKSDGSIIDVNKTAVEKYGYSKAEFLTMRIQQLRHPSTMQDYEAQMKNSALRGLMFECTHVRKDGTSFPVEVSSRTTDINNEMIRIHIVRDITKRRKAEEKINRLANFDALTDIPNRGFLMAKLDNTLEQAKMGKSKFAVMIFDVDKFKLVNDIYGHNAGDEVLKKIGERLQKIVRKTDIIGRLGGDEFLVIQTFIENKEEALLLASKVLEYVAKPVKWNNDNLDVHISIGIAIYPNDSADVQGLISNADSAMYSIKQNGGNYYKCYQAK